MIHKEDAIKEGGTNGEGLLALFTQMATEAEDEGRESAHVVVSFMDEDDEFKEGEWVAELHLCLQKVIK